MTDAIRAAAPKILEAIEASKSILLTCHPSPDGDSVGSNLAMKFALEGMGKKATLIQGDNPIPRSFAHLPGAGSIIPKSFFEIDLVDFDLFLILDIGEQTRISRLGEVKIPESLKTVAIDHHDSTQPFGTVASLIDASYPSVTMMLFDLFKEWHISLTPEIAANLFLGTYTDTGGFKFQKTTPETFLAAADLVRAYPSFSSLVQTMENTSSSSDIYMLGLIFSNIRTFFEGRFAISAISLEDLESRGILPEKAGTSWATSIMRSVEEWSIACACIEIQPNVVKASFRTQDAEKYDLTRLAGALGGGGHKAAAGAVLTMPLPEAIEKIVATAKETYNL